MNSKPIKVYYIGEGKTDRGELDEEKHAHRGVVPRLLHAICGKPQNLVPLRKPFTFLQGKGLWQKVRFAKRSYCPLAQAIVFVVDSEGTAKDCKNKLADLAKGRDSLLPDYPMAVGIAHPCIESWLLADARAIQSALSLDKPPELPQNPEDLPAPQQNRNHNPKTVLRDIAGSAKKEISVDEKDRIAAAMNDLELVKRRCPLGFKPFAEEVETHICPLFRD